MWQDLESRGGDSPIASTAHQIDQITGTELSPEQQKMLIEIRRKKTELLLEIQDENQINFDQDLSNTDCVFDEFENPLSDIRNFQNENIEIEGIYFNEKNFDMEEIDFTMRENNEAGFEHAVETGFETFEEKYSCSNVEVNNEEPNKLECKDCGQFFSHDSYLDEHREISHSVVKAYKCELCKEEFIELNKFIIHKKRHVEKMPHKCKICFKRFKHTGALSKHEYTHACDEEDCKCDICGLKFYMPNSLKKRNVKRKKNRQSYSCDKCDKVFYKEFDILMHIKSNKCNKGDKFNAEKLCNNLEHIISHKRTHVKSKPYKCTECDKSYTQSHALLLHQRHHKGEKVCSCEVCGKSFHDPRNMRKHIQRMHKGESAYKCKNCDRAFKNANSLAVHKLIHMGERPHECKICSKKFYRPESLTKHMATHVVVKPYKCKKCNESFVFKSHLKSHSKVHQGQKCFKCDVCDKAFTLESSVETHKKLHTGERPYKCFYCGRDFITRYTLERHLKMHTADKPYNCEECGRHFTQSKQLENHKAVHTREKPYECGFCGKGFPFPIGLRNHEKSAACKWKFNVKYDKELPLNSIYKHPDQFEEFEDPAEKTDTSPKLSNYEMPEKFEIDYEEFKQDELDEYIDDEFL